MVVNKFGNCKGAFIVEFLAVILIFWLFASGIFDFGWYFYNKHTIELATREGARLGVARNEEDVIKQVIKDRASIAVALADSDIIVSATDTNGTVTTEYTYYFLTPFIGAFFTDGSCKIQAEATYIIEPEPYNPGG